MKSPATYWMCVLTGLVAAFALLLLADGCAVGPNYHRPKPDVPPAFRDAPVTTSTNSIGDLPWWEMFKDETLRGLIGQALANNYDLAVAVTRVEQAHAILAQNRALFFPQASYQASVSRGRNSVAGNAVFENGVTTAAFLGEASASWEIDLWGRIRRLNESARAQYFASQEARRDVMITVISDVASAYFQLLALDQEMAIAQGTTNAYSESLRIFTERYEGGIASKLETSAAEAQYESTAATIPDLERQIAVQENLISVLIGRNPDPITRPHALLQEMLPPEVPAGLPSALLERRPDIREAEQFLRANNAQVGVAVANFFPQISLTALVGKISPELSAITSGESTAWNAGAGLFGPLFQGGRLVGQYHEAVALKEQSRLQYLQTILNAFQEVSNALIAHEKLAEARVRQARAVEAYRSAVQIATQRYVVGQAGYYEVLHQQELLFPAENTLTQIELNQLLSLVQLYRALGGGWVGK